MKLRARCLMLFVLAPGVAAAQSSTDLVRQALELRREGRDAEALSLLQRAWQTEPSARVLAQIGFAEQALGRWLDARAHLREALDAREPWVIERRAVIEEALREIDRHLGALAVQSEAPGSELWVDGRRVGALPLTEPTRVVAGRVVFEVRAAGHVTLRREVTVPPEGVVSERVELARETGALNVTAPGEPSQHDAVASGGHRTWAWIATGGGIAGVALGTAMLLVRNAAASRWNADACLRDGRSRGENCSDDYDLGQTAEAVSVAGFVVGGALAVTATVLWLTAPSPRAARVTAWCGLSGAQVISCGGRF